MNRYLLDTNIISNATKPAPSESLLAWMAEQADEDLFIASLTIAEIRRGILEKPAGRKRDQLEVWFAGPEGPSALFASRILPFDQKAGLVWAADGRRHRRWTTAQRARHDHRRRRREQRLHSRYSQPKEFSRDQHDRPDARQVVTATIDEPTSQAGMVWAAPPPARPQPRDFVY